MTTNSELIVTAAAERRATGEDGGVGNLIREFPNLVRQGQDVRIAISSGPNIRLGQAGTPIGVQMLVAVDRRLADDQPWASLPLDPDQRIINPPAHVVEVPAVVDDDTGEVITPAVLRLDPVEALWEALGGAIARQVSRLRG